MISTLSRFSLTVLSDLAFGLSYLCLGYNVNRSDVKGVCFEVSLGY